MSTEVIWSVVAGLIVLAFIVWIIAEFIELRQWSHYFRGYDRAVSLYKPLTDAQSEYIRKLQEWRNEDAETICNLRIVQKRQARLIQSLHQELDDPYYSNSY